MGKNNRKNKSKKKNSTNKKVQNNNNNDKTTTTVVEPATILPQEKAEAITSLIDSTVSSSNSVKNDSAITTTETFSELEKIAKKDNIEEETATEPVVTPQTLNLTETVKSSLNKELNNNKNSLSTTTNIINTDTIKTDTIISLSPIDNPIIMATIHSVCASHQLDLLSILSNIKNNNYSEIKKPLEKSTAPIILEYEINKIVSVPAKEIINDQNTLLSTDDNIIETNPIIKSTIESVVASYHLDSLSIINKINNNNKKTIDSPQQIPLSKEQEEKEKKPMTASPTPSHASSFKNSQNILNGSFHGKSGSPPHTDAVNAKGI